MFILRHWFSGLLHHRYTKTHFSVMPFVLRKKNYGSILEAVVITPIQVNNDDFECCNRWFPPYYNIWNNSFFASKGAMQKKKGERKMPHFPTFTFPFSSSSSSSSSFILIQNERWTSTCHFTFFRLYRFYVTHYHLYTNTPFFILSFILIHKKQTYVNFSSILVINTLSITS